MANNEPTENKFASHSNKRTQRNTTEFSPLTDEQLAAKRARYDHLDVTTRPSTRALFVIRDGVTAFLREADDEAAYLLLSHIALADKMMGGR